MYGKSTFLGLNTAMRGVLAQQTALDVTGHNIANLNTEGYSRQRAQIVTSTPWSSSALNSYTTPGQLGTGVEVSSLERLRDSYVDRNARDQFGRQASAETTVGQLSQVEDVFAEPSENGLAARMREFFTALDRVAAQPQDTSARQVFAQAADRLATSFRQLSSDLAGVAQQSDDRLDQAVLDVNGLTTRIATLNGQIRDATFSGQQPNDLLDERDRLLDALAKQVDYTYTESATTREVTVTFGSAAPINLVDPTVAGGSTPLTRADLDTAFTNGDLSSGAAFADERLLNTTIPAQVQALDDLVASIVGGMNAGNAGGFDLNGVAGGDIFDAAGTTAATMQLDVANNIRTNPRLVAAASSWNAPGEPGNGDNAGAMNAMRSLVQGPPLNASWEGFYGSTVSALGQSQVSAQRDLDNTSLLVEMANGRRSQVSGVSLDEEMTNMLRFQHAYNASARVMTTMDDALDTLINRMGRVGL